MRNLWRCRTLWLLLVLIVIAMLATSLSGCASSMRIESDRPLPLSVEMSAPQSPDAKDFSKRASDYSEKVERYFKETPTFTTP